MQILFNCEERLGRQLTPLEIEHGLGDLLTAPDYESIHKVFGSYLHNSLLPIYGLDLTSHSYNICLPFERVETI